MNIKLSSEIELHVSMEMPPTGDLKAWIPFVYEKFSPFSIQIKKPSPESFYRDLKTKRS